MGSTSLVLVGGALTSAFMVQPLGAYGWRARVSVALASFFLLPPAVLWLGAHGYPPFGAAGVLTLIGALVVLILAGSARDA